MRLPSVSVRLSGMAVLVGLAGSQRLRRVEGLGFQGKGSIQGSRLFCGLELFSLLSSP